MPSLFELKHVRGTSARIGAALVFAAVATFVGTGAGHAQYVLPPSSLVCSVSTTSILTGNTVLVTALVTDTTGLPMPGQFVTFIITSQPGSSASIAPGVGTTNASGVATASLNVGTTAGQILVRAFSQTACQVIELVTAPPPPVIQQVQGVQQPAPPKTGDAGLVGSAGAVAAGHGSGSSTELYVLIAIIGLGLLAFGSRASKVVRH